jgi:hypothetical protein
MLLQLFRMQNGIRIQEPQQKYGLDKLALSREAHRIMTELP